MEDEFVVNCRELIFDVLKKEQNSKTIEKELIYANVEFIKSNVPHRRGVFLFIRKRDVEKFINYLKLSKFEKYERTCNIKYGVNNVSQVQSIIDKKKETFDKNREFHKKVERPIKQLSQRKLKQLKILQEYPNQYDKNNDLLCSKVSSMFDLSTATIKNYCKYLGINIIEKYQGVKKVFTINNDDLEVIKHWIEENPDKNDRMNIMLEKTMMERYGVKHALQSKQFLTKSMNTCELHYGVKHPAQNEEIKENWKKTNIRIYGVENPSQAQCIKDKKTETTLSHYGVENPFQSQELILTCKETKLKKYGRLHNPRQFSKYVYDDVKFDSKPELYFYIYHHDILKDDITRGKNFKYKDSDGIDHIYECDFLVNGENIEIKGEHLINENMELVEFCTNNIKYEKTQCMRDNNVRLILSNSDEMNEIINVVTETYPNLDIEDFKIFKSDNDETDLEQYLDYFQDSIFEMI